MTLKEYVIKQKDSFDKFQKNYEYEQKTMPELYPYTMEERDWDEQFLVFLNNN